MKNTSLFKRCMVMLLCFCMIASSFTFASAAADYDSAVTENVVYTGGLCPHHTAHDENCGYKAATEEVPCDKGCTDTDGDGVIDHADGCAYKAAEEGVTCGYKCEKCTAADAQSVDNSDTDNDDGNSVMPTILDDGDEDECRTEVESDPVDELQALIDTLPEAEEITEDNAEAVGEQLNAIDKAKLKLSDEQRNNVDFAAYDAAIAALNALSGEGGAEEPAVTSNKTVTLDNDVELYYVYDGGGVADGCAELRKIQGSPQNAVDLVIPSTVELGGTSYSVIVGVTSISKKCKENIKSLTFSDGISSVSGNFNGLNAINSLTVPGSVKSFSATLQNCTSLQTIIFEEGVEEITGNSMLYGCSALKQITLPSTLKKLGDAVFSEAAALESIALPEGVQIPDTTALFYGCSALKSVELPASVTEIGAEMFYGCTALESVTAKGTITKVGDYAFEDCPTLKIIPDLSKVTEIGYDAFYGCTGLTGKIDLSSATTIGEYAFSDCKIDELVLSQSLNSISEGLFCYSAFSEGTELELPDSVAEIGEYAFYGTSGLKSVKIGSNVKIINATAFCNSNIEEIIIDNSEDNVTWSGTAPDGVTVTYLRPSIGNAGDKISDAEDALTLQQAIDAAPDNEPATITISKNIKVSAGLNVPANKNITIESEEGGNYTIIADGKASPAVESLFTVAEGANVTFRNVTLSGAGSSGSVVSTQGAVTLGSGAVVQYGKGKLDSGVIAATGSAASITIDGGTVKDNLITNQRSGAVYASGGAQVNMRSGEISGNKVTDSNAYNSSSGIMLADGGVGTMTGGSITGNSAIRGNGVMVYSVDGKGRSTFTLSGGSISGNSCESGSHTGSGAVHVEGDAAFTMTGGSVSNNAGVNGAGVCVVDPGLQDKTAESQTAFTMNGGTISGNTGSTGGGIYSYSNYVNLNAGAITGNKAYMGGGVYSEGNTTAYSTLHMQNALITANSSDDQGGGLWLCPTGMAVNYVTDGGAIYDNTAYGAGDDVVSAASGDGGGTLTLADRMLGGGRVEWYPDGKVYVPSGMQLPSTGKDAARYPNAGTGMSVKSDAGDLALKSVAGDDAKALAAGKAALTISGNVASGYGGGVAANGGVVIGIPDTNLKDIPVSKTWVHNGNADMPASVTVKLVRTDTEPDYVLETAVLNADNGWKYTFTGLLDDGTYTVTEAAVKGYASALTGDEENGFVFTNTFEVGSLTVSKTVTGEGADKTKEFSFELTLTDRNGAALSGSYGGLSFTDGKASFTLKDGEKKTIDNLPAGTNYTVTEAQVKSFTSTYTGANGTIQKGETAQAVFTNNYETVSVSVTKVWSDNKNKDGARPSSVTMQLYKDGEAYGDTVTLSASNSWTYVWNGLEADSEYTVKEINIPNGYYALTKQSGNNITITNTYGAKTGDEANLTLWAALAGLSATGLVGAGISVNRKKRKDGADK